MEKYDLFSIHGKNISVSEHLKNGFKIADTAFTLKNKDGYNELYKNSEHITNFSQIHENIEIRPTLLDKPIYIKLRNPVTVLPGETINFCLERPLDGELVIKHEDKTTVLHKFSLYNYKLINYGIVTNGIVCYYIESDIVTKPKIGNYAMVPVTVINKHNRPNLISKLIIDKNFLKILVTPDMFMTNNVTARVRTEKIAYITYTENKDEKLEILKTYHFENEKKQPAIFKMLKSFQKKGTGIEYGF